MGANLGANEVLDVAREHGKEGAVGLVLVLQNEREQAEDEGVHVDARGERGKPHEGEAHHVEEAGQHGCGDHEAAGEERHAPPLAVRLLDEVLEARLLLVRQPRRLADRVVDHL